ncbi:DUF4328 domain-containing protein [Solirubrobacter taibaiensis]|nr:DUF4328 domain-containing protein [Solirubrobacter taibaiensis]
MATESPQYQPAPPLSPDPVITSHPAQHRIWRPLENRLLAVKIVFCLIVGVWVLAVISGVFELLLANRAAAGENIAPNVLNASDTRQMFVGWVQWALWVAGAIVFIMWLYRAYQNVDATEPGRRRYGYGWTIGSWFVPILNLWRPKKIVNDIWRAGQNPGDPGFLLIAWWLLWLANGFVSSSARGAYSNADTPEEWRTGIIRYLVADGLGALAALLAVLVVIKLTRNLNARAQAADGSLFRDSSREAPTDAPSVMTMTPSETPTGR